MWQGQPSHQGLISGLHPFTNALTVIRSDGYVLTAPVSGSSVGSYLLSNSLTGSLSRVSFKKNSHERF
jgi:hypothetical protein